MFFESDCGSVPTKCQYNIKFRCEGREEENVMISPFESSLITHLDISYKKNYMILDMDCDRSYIFSICFIVKTKQNKKVPTRKKKNLCVM